MPKLVPLHNGGVMVPAGHTTAMLHGARIPATPLLSSQACDDELEAHQGHAKYDVGRVVVDVCASVKEHAWSIPSPLTAPDRGPVTQR